MPPITPDQRAAKVRAAVADVGPLMAAAVATAAEHGPHDVRTLAAWADVEAAGAMIHRQARLLAGKSKGG